MLRPLLVLAFIAAVSLSACRDEKGSRAVVATTTQAADMARAVAGDRTKVEQILNPGSDPHEYEPRPSDAQAVATAKVVIRSGGDVDEWPADLRVREFPQPRPTP